MTKSALQIARAAYIPKVPVALKGAVQAIALLSIQALSCQADRLPAGIM